MEEEVGQIKKLVQEIEELIALNSIALTEKDEHISRELEQELGQLTHQVDELETKSLLSGEFDKNDAIVSIHPGAGGTESQDWAEILLRMYLRWADQKGFKTDINDYLAGEEAGLKSATFTVHGPYAFGLLEAEKGVHRLVRISPFDQAKRRHTSFASVDVIPLVEEKRELQINPDDLKIETYRASGPGGQHVNVTDSAVRITHLPTKIAAQSQSERSQFRNKEIALSILKARLFDRMREEHIKKIEELRGEKEEIAFGSQIRSYVFHPYRMIKDHRTDLEVGNVEAVMNGEINQFIESYLRRVKRKE